MIIIGSTVAGCSIRNPTPETRTVRGELKFYPSNVKSVQSLYGHNFVVDGVPILPTAQIPEDKLKTFVGKLVIVQGVWRPGKPFTPTEEDNNMQMPVNTNKQNLMRGDGLQATSIASTEQ